MPASRHRALAGALGSLLLALGACHDQATGPDLAQGLTIRPLFAVAGSAGPAGVVEIATTRVVLARADGTVVLDSVVTVPPGATEITLEVEVVVSSDTEEFDLSLAFRDPSGSVVFTGGPVRVRPVAATDTGPVLVDVPTTYVGPGADAAAVQIIQRGAVVPFGGSLTLAAEALDAQGQPLANTPIVWSSLDPTVASVPDPAVGTVVAGTTEGTARIVATLLTGQADTLTISVVPTVAGADWIFHASGISNFDGVDRLNSGRFLELVDPVNRIIYPELANSRGDEEIVGLAYDPITNRVFATDRDCDLLSIDPATGTEVLVGNISGSDGFCGGPPNFAKGLAFEPGTGRLLAGPTPEFSDGNLYDIDPATAVSTVIGQVTTVGGVPLDGYNGFAFQPGTGVLYVVGHQTGDVLRDRYLMTVNVSTLTATPIALLPQTGVASITFTSDGTLYAVTGDGATVPETLWTVDLGTAAMTQVMPLGNGDDGEAIVAVPSQPVGSIWTTSGDGTAIATIDAATGVGATVGPVGFSQTWAAAFDIDGTLYTLVNGFSGNAQLATVNLATGAATPIGQGLGFNMISLEFDAAGTLYGIGYADALLYQIDKTAGTATSIGSTGINSNMDLAFNSAGTLYATTNDQLWTVDVSTGASTPLGPVTGVCTGGQIMGIMFDAQDVLYATNYAASDASCLMTIDLTTLAATVVGLTGLQSPHGGDIRVAVD